MDVKYGNWNKKNSRKRIFLDLVIILLHYRIKVSEERFVMRFLKRSSKTRRFKRTHKEIKNKMKKVSLFICISAFVVFFPRFAGAATLYFSPSGGSFSVGSTFSVSVRTNTQGQAVNTAEATITYTADTLELVSVGGGSSFPLQTPGSPSKSFGQAYFSGGVPTPGYNGVSGSVGSMTFRAKAVGTAQLAIDSGKILLNDGEGTNALAGTSGATFTITPPPVGNVQVSSQTHPNPNDWYAKSAVELSWSRPEGAYGFSFDFDQEPVTIPDNQLDTTVTTKKTYENVKDGTWYFHIKSRGQTGSFGGTVHFKVQIDNLAPNPPTITLEENVDANAITGAPNIIFESSDSGSGIASYDILIDGDLVQEKATSPYKLEKLKKGKVNVEVKAYDRAGNSSSSNLVLNVTAPLEGSAPASVKLTGRSITIPLYIVWVAGGLLLLLLLLVILLSIKRRKRRDDPLELLKAQIDASLEDLKDHMHEELVKFAEHYSQSAADKGKGVLNDLDESIDKTRTKLDNQVEKAKRSRKRTVTKVIESEE